MRLLYLLALAAGIVAVLCLPAHALSLDAVLDDPLAAILARAGVAGAFVSGLVELARRNLASLFAVDTPAAQLRCAGLALVAGAVLGLLGVAPEVPARWAAAGQVVGGLLSAFVAMGVVTIGRRTARAAVEKPVVGSELP
jgi:hypothetical protein